MAQDVGPGVDDMYYRLGWNNMEYGINNWTGSSKWAGPKEWAAHMKQSAENLRDKSAAVAQFNGTIDCAKHYLEHGSVGRK